MFSHWQERDEEGSEGEDLLLDQLMVGLQPGCIIQELNRQMRPNERMSFADTCKEAWALEQELLEGKDPVTA